MNSTNDLVPYDAFISIRKQSSLMKEKHRCISYLYREVSIGRGKEGVCEAVREETSAAWWIIKQQTMYDMYDVGLTMRLLTLQGY